MESALVKAVEEKLVIKTSSDSPATILDLKERTGSSSLRRPGSVKTELEKTGSQSDPVPVLTSSSVTRHVPPVLTSSSATRSVPPVLTSSSATRHVPPVLTSSSATRHVPPVLTSSSATRPVPPVLTSSSATRTRALRRPMVASVSSPPTPVMCKDKISGQIQGTGKFPGLAGQNQVKNKVPSFAEKVEEKFEIPELLEHIVQVEDRILLAKEMEGQGKMKVSRLTKEIQVKDKALPKLETRCNQSQGLDCSLDLISVVQSMDRPFSSILSISEGVNPGDLHRPIGLCLLKNGNLVVASTFEDQVKLYLPNGQFVSSLRIPGRRFIRPSDMASLAGGQFVVRDARGIMVFSSTGRFQWKLTDSSKSFGLAQDGDGFLVTILESGRGQAASLVFFDLNTDKIVRKKDLADVVGVVDRSRSKCRFLTYCRDQLYVTDLGLDRVYVFDSSANILQVFGNTGSGPGCFDDPAGLDVDGEGNMVVADSRNHRVSLYSKDGRFVSHLRLNPPVKRPSGLLLDRDRKELYILNLAGNKALVKYNFQ